MDIISQFETKVRFFGGKKMVSAREVMKIFWYSKWERFLWSIHRATETLDKERIWENFYFVTHKTTGWRPREDVLLTLGGCYLVLQHCDQRKQPVIEISKYLKKLSREVEEGSVSLPPQKKAWNLAFVLFSIFLGVVFVSLFFSQSSLFSQVWKQHILDDLIFQADKKRQIEIEEKVFQEFDDKIFWSTQLLNENGIVWGKKNTIIEYASHLPQNSSMKWYDASFYQNFQEGFNPRTTFSQLLQGELLIEAYFEFGNYEAYRESCSLLGVKDCLASSKGDLGWFANFWKKTKNGYFDIEVKTVQDDGGKKSYCVSYSYFLRNDLSEFPIREVFHFSTEVRNWFEQITGRYCEQITKWSRNIACPFQLQNYYCK